MPSAEHVRWAKVRSSCVILVALIILSVLIYLLTGGSLFEKKAMVYLYVPDASGVATGSPVRADGVDVGKVSAIDFAPTGQPQRVIRLTLSIDHDALRRISADSNAQLSADSLVGDMFVDISNGISREHVRAGSEIAYQAQPDMLKTLDLQQFDAALKSMDQTLTDIEQARSPVGQFVMGTGFYDNMRVYLRDIENAVRKAAGVTGSVGQPLYTDTDYERIRKPILALDRSLAEIQAGQGMGGMLLRDTAEYDHFQSLAQDLRKSISAIRSGELFQSDGMYKNLSVTLGQLIRSVDEFNTSPLMVNSSVYEGLDGAARSIRDSARDFHSNPKAYLWMKIF